MAEEMRDTLLTHLHELNQAVNASINILSYLPDVAKQFGLEAFIKLETVSWIILNYLFFFPWDGQMNVN